MELTERLEVIGGLFQPIDGVPVQPENPADITDWKHTCKVCAREIFGDSDYCAADGGED